MTVEALT